jgi:hypothetical protein
VEQMLAPELRPGDIVVIDLPPVGWTPRISS